MRLSGTLDELVRVIGVLTYDKERWFRQGEEDDFKWYDRKYCDYVTTEEMIKRAEDALLELDRPQGKWDFIGDNMYECTECCTPFDLDTLSRLKTRTYESDLPNFCPKCGADMGGDKNGR